METLPCPRTDASAQAELAVSDGLLLERFIREQDESAFAELVRRHGPMVLGVCRRVLDNPHDAEDCFQAAFMVLVRKAESIQPRDMVGNWLYGVAYRTALEARKLAARRRVIEKKKTMPEPHEASPWHSMRPVLDRELSRLPDKFRFVIVACDLEGKTRREVADLLDLPEGTVASRLARGRRLLAKRLSRYELSISGGALGSLLSREGAEPVPPMLVSATAKAAVHLAGGEGALSPFVAALCDAVVKSMLWTKIQIAAASLAVIAALAFVIVALIPAAQAERKPGMHPLAKPDKFKPQEYLRDCILAKVDPSRNKIEVRKLQLPGDESKPVTYSLLVEPTTLIFIDGREAPLSELREGFSVHLQIDAGRARRIEAFGEELRGIVLAIDNDTVTLGPENAQADAVKKTCKLDPDVWVVVNGKKVKSHDLKVRMRVTVQMSAAKPVAVGIKAAGPKVAGIVKGIDAKKQTLEMSIDDTHLVADAAVAAEAEVVIDGVKSKLADVKTGMRVTLQMSAETERSYIVAITAGPRK